MSPLRESPPSGAVVGGFRGFVRGALAESKAVGTSRLEPSRPLGVGPGVAEAEVVRRLGPSAAPGAVAHPLGGVMRAGVAEGEAASA